MRTGFLPLATGILLVAAVLRLWQLHIYPPGPHYDEAVEILITRSIAFNGANFFPIVNSYQGREALFYYLSAPLFQLAGDGAFTLRLVNVFCNLIAIAASLALGRAMFRGQRGVVVGLTVGALMALSFPQIWLSRQAFRTGPLPMLQALALLFLWRGLNARRRDWQWLVPAGFFAGAALYTYMASRLFPFWLLLAALGLVVVDAGSRRRRIRQGAVFFAVLAITALPMGAYALERPDVFFRRLSEVTTGETVSLGESIRRHAAMFFLQGEAYVRYNIPGRPYLTWSEGLLMLAGMGIAAVRLLRSGRPTERAAYWLALLSPLMVIPSVISVGGLPPNHMRSVGMVPLIFVLVAVGFEALFGALLGRFNRISPPRALAVITMATLVVGGLLVGSIYFDWARRADVFYETDADLALAARWLPSQVDDSADVYVGSRHVEHPTLIAGWGGAVTWLGQNTLFRPPEGRSALVIYAHNDPPPADWAAWLEPYRLGDLPAGPDGGPAFLAYRLPPGVPLPPVNSRPVQVIQNGLVTLVGLQLPVVAAGEAGEIVLHWRIDRPPTVTDLTPLLQLEDRSGALLDRAESYLVHTDQWHPGEVMLHRMTVHVPIGTPPGKYPLRLTWVGHESGVYVPFVDSAGVQSGVWAEIGQMEVVRPAVFPPADRLAVENRHNLDVAPGIRLLGWDFPPAAIRPGETLAFRLFWRATPLDGQRPSVSIRGLLRGEAGDAVIYQGNPAGEYPSDAWIDGELVTAPMYWKVPRQQPAGRYSLRVQVGEADLELATVEVAGVPRVFDPPPVQQIVQSRLGESLSLYGYSLDTAKGVQLDLVWQALGEVTEDYTVFVHVIDEGGAIVRQRDVMPQNNAYPTSLWTSGEYIADQHGFPDLPPGRYHLRVGLYLQSTGRRLPISSAGAATDFIEIGPLEVAAAS